MAQINNPILTGFQPDPSILRVGNDYYIATSTFEWFPGVQIHHSTDLVNWELVAHPLNRLTQLNMLGEASSCGVWAPCLTYDNGTFYLIYTDVKAFRGPFKDTHNYLVTATDICGEWSDPIYLNSSGFDPSLFHDSDGKKYLVNMLMDYRCFNRMFGGVVLQEYSEQEQKLVGENKLIFKGTALGCTEAPHLYRHGDYYYLMTAEGGTEFAHAVTLARSKNIEGPYEVCPQNPILTTAHRPDYPIQKSGHASITDTPDGRWLLVHLCARPVGAERRCILGRETALQQVEWKDRWLQLCNGTNLPDVCWETQGEAGKPVSRELYESFDGPHWSRHLQTLRIPLDERASLTQRKGWLRLYGAESLTSAYRQSLLAHRQQAFCCNVTTCVEFAPEHFQQLAGLVYYYDSTCYYYLHITYHERFGRVLSILCCDLGKGVMPIGAGIPLPDTGAVWLRIEINQEQAQFYWSLDGEQYTPVGPVLDATMLSDDYYKKTGHVLFTGAYIGICCQDLSGMSKHADFDFYHYEEGAK